MNNTDNLRVAFLYPSVELGAYWLPVLDEFKKIFRQTIFYTGRLWPGFDPETPGASVIKVVGQTNFVEMTNTVTGYSRGFYKVSPNIIGDLLRYKPHVIITSTFTIWTLLALLFKPLGKWRVVIIWDGSSPNVDFRDSKARLFLRRLMARFTDAFVSNSRDGKAYLMEFIHTKESKTFNRPYLVPEPKALSKQLENFESTIPQMQRPVFLYVGRIEQRKGIHYLLEACAILRGQGYSNYTLIIVGDGPQRKELEVYSKNHGIEDCVKWIGWVNYSNLGAYFYHADIFVFPTLEDIWGMVVPEAMAFSKPVLCSQWAGAAEMVIEGENGYIFDPYHPERLAEIMRRFIDNQDLIVSMGQKSRQLISQHTPKDAAKFLADITYFVFNQ
jgi:glycosyltransferase involved in cell wall biosynthesis